MRQIAITRELILDALGNLYALRQRSILALTGVAIGTAAVVVMICLGHFAKREAMRQLETMGTDLIAVQIVSEAGKREPLRSEHIASLMQAVPDVTQAIPLIVGGSEVRRNSAIANVSIVAAPPELFSIGRITMTKGREVSVYDDRAPYVVIGPRVLDAFARLRGTPSESNSLIIRTTAFEIIGSMSNTVPNMVLGVDFNSAAIIPLAAARRVFADTQITHVLGRIKAGSDDQTAAEATTAFFEKQAPGSEIRVQTARQLIRTVENQMQIYEFLLLGIGGVSLIVGGVGIMNVMLMNVIERRKEIGIRRAIGAREIDIKIMFLIESLALSLVGAFFGIFVGLGAGVVFSKTVGWIFEFPPMAVPLAIGMAICTGIFFGSYPAGRAARLDPITALRSE